MSARSGIWMLAALAPVVAGCGVAKHLLPGGTRYDGASHTNSESCLLPPSAELSCIEFVHEGSAASPPIFPDETLEELPVDRATESDLLPLTAPGEEGPIEPARSVLTSSPTTASVGYDLPAPVIVETEEEARQSLALEAASLAVAPRRISTDVAVGPLKDPIERDPSSTLSPAPLPPRPAIAAPTASQLPDLPLVPPAPRTLAEGQPVRADYVNAPLAKVARHLHLPHRRLGEGVMTRPGSIAGLHGRFAGHREPPEAVPFVVYERVAPRFLPVPTRPAFESATAVYAVDDSPPAAPGISIRPPLSVPPRPRGELPGPMVEDLSPRQDAAPPPMPEETLPRSLPSMEALPLPQPEMILPPAPRIDDF